MTDSLLTAPATQRTPVVRHSPVGHLADQIAATGSEQTVRLRETPYRAQAELRVSPAEAEVADRLASQFLGCPLPAPQRASGAGNPWVLWAGPGWYLVVDEDPASTGWGLVSGLRCALGGEYGQICASVVDVSAQRTILELRGPRARDVLSHGCALDLHPREFRPGHYAQTHLAKATVGLLQTDTTPTYRILVRCSYADYLARWILDAMAEYVQVTNDQCAEK
ncbi:sarcosine oxidase subunit gamma family protein [Lipingzhangella sp. LS1_29]|uniref:Sarcosine oxidase subunit gamma family protein n=1 Tax=Lipingzhangella rawalii TaxID=2055835 RepID=A0ABU2H2R6_9ACTN|nr:sarcosine oxidase subunit gamma family protein [Lipingzhangella rawalii]MDS1269591.1 sarcosine oxidase subunit gamma family protein [Lipingzhangella rawalii]